MIFTATHIGFLRGDARIGDVRPKVLLRETKRYWITKTRTKYCKTTGWPVGSGSWPLWKLDTDSVKEMTDDSRL
jgi:hypothetical protein